MTENEFIAAFQKLCDEATLFVPTDKLHPAKTNCYFSLELVDETPMLRGLGIVIDSWSISQNPFEQPGIHVRITQLTTLSEPVFERILAARPAGLRQKGPRTRNAPMTHQQWGSMVAPSTTEMDAPALADDDIDIAQPPRTTPDSEETVPARPVTRELRSPSIPALPSIPSPKPGISGPTRKKQPSMSAAPIAELDEKTTETTRYGDHMRLPASAPTAAPAVGSAPARTSAAGSPPPPMASPASVPSAPPVVAPVNVTFNMPSERPRLSAPAELDADPSLDRLPATWWQAAWWREHARGWREHARAWREQLRSGRWRHAWWANRRVAGVFAGGLLLGVLFTVLLRPSHPTKPPALAANVPVKQDLASCPQVPATPTVVANVDDASTHPASAPHANRKIKVAAATPTGKHVVSAPATKVAPTSKVASAATKSASTATKVAAATPASKATSPTSSKVAAAPASKSTTKATTPTKPSQPSTTKPSQPSTSRVAATPTTKPAQPTTTRVAVKPPTTKPAKSTATASTPASSARNVAATKKTSGKRGVCSSLDCI